jgi:transcriptional regulator with XRE-family HTH domain
MKPMTLDELDARLAQDQEYLAAERELRPDLNLANDVLDFRVEKGWTQAELAKAVGTNQANISRLESALANPTFRFLKKLARALDAELDVRLRRPDDIPGNETLQSAIQAITPRLETLNTGTSTFEGRVSWSGHAVSLNAEAIISAENTSSC